MIYVVNAFSLQMLPPGLQIWVSETGAGYVTRTLRAVGESGWTSAVGHADTAEVISGVLGLSVPHNRINVTLDLSDVLFVAQLQGGRLPEGCSELPPGFSLAWRAVVVIDPADGAEERYGIF